MKRVVGARILSCVGLVLGIGTLGCRSASSTHVEPDPTAHCGWSTKHLRGVPVTVLVPYQLQVRILELRYVDKSGTPVMVDGIPLTTIQADTKVLEKNIVFTVDAVRPAAGKLEYSAEFTKQQYFKSFNSKVDDKTIEAITNSINSITGTLAKLPTASPKSFINTPDQADLGTVENLIAVEVFDIYEPGLECRVQEFLARHLNACAPGCVKPIPPKPILPGPGPIIPTPIGRP